MRHFTVPLELTSGSGIITDFTCIEMTKLLDSWAIYGTAGKFLGSTGNNQTAM